MTSAAIYARVSSARQKKDQTIGSQTAALRQHAGQSRLEVPEEWVFEDEGHSGATLVRPGLEALRDLAAQGCLDVVLCYSPDRLARKFAYQALLIEEFARAGVRVEFVQGPRGDSPEDQLLVQFQGMFAEYEKAQLMERYRRGKAHRARTGSVNVLSGAPFGYRYVRKSDLAGAVYEIAGHEAALVAEMFRRYADDGAAIADLARWLTSQGVPTRTGKDRWDRSVVWGMLRNPAYAGTAVFGKTQVVQEPAGLNRVARLQGRSVPRATRTIDRPRGEWTQIPVPAIVTAETFERVQQRLADNKRFAARNTKVPSLLQGLAACSACGYGYYRTSTRTTSKKIYYCRCLGSDDYRYPGGRVCRNQPVRADYLDQVVWDHITGLLADPALIRAEISKRLEQARTSDPVTRQRKQLELALAKATTSITAMIGPTPNSSSPSTNCAPGCRTCAPGKPACAARSTASTPRPPTGTPTSNSPTTWNPSSPSFAPTPTPPRQKNASGCCGCSSRTSSSAPRRSPSGTASPPAQAPPAPAGMTPTPIRRVTMARVIHCVGGVPYVPCGAAACGC
jgi:DNA invertase Pin-like site-specific DNA recombinase